MDLCGGIGTSCGNTLEVLHGYLVWYYLRTSKLEVLHGYLVGVSWVGVVTNAWRRAVELIVSVCCDVV